MFRLIPSATVVGTAAALVVLVAPGAQAHSTDSSTYSAPLTTAIGHISTATENNSGYERDKFKLWIDADGDGCDTRHEVLLQEADDPPTVGASCKLTGGRWYSYYDGVDHYDASELDIDHVVPLAEAWGSGARSWTAQEREDYANDLGDTRTLVAVTASVNRSKGDRDPSDWLPPINHCRYIKDWVAAKIRWSLTADSAEKSAREDAAAGCTNSTITVTVVSE